MGIAVWNDMTREEKLRVTAHGPAFPNESRIIAVTYGQRVQLEVVSGPGAGLAGSAETGFEAMRILLLGLLGEPCAHDRRTGYDTCPGCAVDEAKFLKAHPETAPVPRYEHEWPPTEFWVRVAARQGTSNTIEANQVENRKRLYRVYGDDASNRTFTGRRINPPPLQYLPRDQEE